MPLGIYVLLGIALPWPVWVAGSFLLVFRKQLPQKVLFFVTATVVGLIVFWGVGWLLADLMMNPLQPIVPTATSTVPLSWYVSIYSPICISMVLTIGSTVFVYLFLRGPDPQISH